MSGSVCSLLKYTPTFFTKKEVKTLCPESQTAGTGVTFRIRVKNKVKQVSQLASSEEKSQEQTGQIHEFSLCPTSSINLE